MKKVLVLVVLSTLALACGHAENKSVNVDSVAVAGIDSTKVDSVALEADSVKIKL